MPPANVNYFLAYKELTFDVNLSDTILSVKEQIHKLPDCPRIDLQCLIFAGKKLEDERTLREYDIHKLSKLHLVIKPASGTADAPGAAGAAGAQSYNFIKGRGNIIKGRGKKKKCHNKGKLDTSSWSSDKCELT